MIGLEGVLREATCLVGVGNPFRRDDGVGPAIAENLRGRVAGFPLSVVNAEDVPENHVFAVAAAGCRNVLIVDAVAAEGEPGTVVFGPLEDFDEPCGVSTHKAAFGLCARILRDSGKNVFLLGIVPRDLDFGSGLSEEVARSAEIVESTILRTLEAIHEETLHER